jgi:isopentenyl-diphosphate delta-isomerase
MEEIILVDEHNNALGSMEKLQAHKLGVLHRAISIFIFNTNGELLLQQRASNKYHSANLWTNTCCSHPRPNETAKDAAKRRLMDEMGMSCELHHAFDFTYRAELENNLIEHEYDHVFKGITNATPIINTDEARSYRYITYDDLHTEIRANPEQFTEWFKLCINDYPHKLFKL